MMLQDSLVVLDFETTGLSPERGDRITEVGLVRVEGGTSSTASSRWSTAACACLRSSLSYTGISQQMVDDAPYVKHVMRHVVSFVGRHTAGCAQRQLRPALLSARMPPAGHQHGGRTVHLFHAPVATGVPTVQQPCAGRAGTRTEAQGIAAPRIARRPMRKLTARADDAAGARHRRHARRTDIEQQPAAAADEHAHCAGPVRPRQALRLSALRLRARRRTPAAHPPRPARQSAGH